MAKAGLPSISVRKYIKWGDEPAGENTSTLVLTSPLKSFVDIRIYQPLPRPSPEPLPISHLEWAFAGKSSSTPAREGQPLHTVWKHWVDSLHVDASQVMDEGDMLVQENGELLERGAMVNPQTGLLTSYEESWLDIKPSTESGENTGCVLMCDQQIDGTEVKGMIVRVGAKAQGILRCGGEISVARWISENDGVWGKTAWIGRIQSWDTVQESWTGVIQGQVLTDHGLEWHCVENFEWA